MAMDDAPVPPIDLSAPLRVHVVAVGGAAMGPIARILAAMGHRVSGSDAVASAALDRLIEGEARQLVPSWWPQRDSNPCLRSATR